MKRLVVVLVAVGVLGGCSTLDKLNPFSSAPKVKMAELTPIQATADLRLVWQGRVAAAAGYGFVPAVVGNTVFAAGQDGSIVRFDGGRESWRVKAGKILSGGVGADGKVVVVGTPKGEILAFDADGKPIWQARVSSEVLAPPLVESGMVIVRSGDSRIYAFDVADGKQRWVYQRSTPALTLRSAAGVIAVADGILAGFPGGKLVALSAGNGAAIWEATVSLPHGSTELERVADVVSLPVVSGTSVCAVAYQGKIGCFDLASGSPIWTRDMSSSVGLDADERHIYFTDDKGAVHAMDLATGASVWTQDKLFHRGVSRPVVAGRYVIVGDVAGVVHVIKGDDGAFAARYNTDGSAVISEPRALDGGAIVQTRDGGIYALAVK